MDKKITREEPKYPNKPIDLSKDPNTNEVIADILSRCNQGMDKFGITMRSVMLQNPKDALYWLNHSYEEKIDDIRYTKEAIQSFRNLNEDHKKLKIKYEKLLKKIKDLKEYNKMLMEHP